MREIFGEPDTYEISTEFRPVPLRFEGWRVGAAEGDLEPGGEHKYCDVFLVKGSGAVAVAAAPFPTRIIGQHEYSEVHTFGTLKEAEMALRGVERFDPGISRRMPKARKLAGEQVRQLRSMSICHRKWRERVGPLGRDERRAV